MNSVSRSVLAVPAFTFGAALVSLLATSAQAVFTTFEAGGTTPAAITPTRDAFRTAVGGGSVAGANGSFGGLRREINWDAVPDNRADTNAFPADFFNTTSPRGAVFSTPGTGFLVSANAGLTPPILFGFFNDFQAFSQQRLFTAVNSNITDVSFFVPGTNTPTTTSAFGAILTDVEVAGQTKIEFFDQSNTLIYSRDALTAGNQGLTFLGAVAGAGEQISRVRLTSGLNTIVRDGVISGPESQDLVAMDDFLFAEPTALPEPGALALVGLGWFAVGLNRRGRRGVA